jgi:abhydrolase domain-containing protein 6
VKKKIVIAIIAIVIAIIAIVIAVPITIYFTAPGLVYRASISSSRCKAGLTAKSVMLGDHRIAYLEGGAGPVVLLVHGYSGEKDHWTRFAKFLTPSYHVVIPDLPGFGESTKSWKAKYGILDQADRLAGFIEKLKLGPVHLVGNSMGGNIAGALAARKPELVRSLALFDSSGVMPPKKSVMQLAWDRGVNLLLVSNADDYDRVMKLCFSKPIWLPGPVKSYFAEKAVAARPFNRKVEMDRRAEKYQLGPSLGLIRARTLILWGDEDRILDISAVALFERGIKNHVTVIMKKCGHTPMLERPDETAGHYLDFLKGS